MSLQNKTRFFTGIRQRISLKYCRNSEEKWGSKLKATALKSNLESDWRKLPKYLQMWFKPVNCKSLHEAHTLLDVSGHTYRCLCGFINGEDVCWFVCAGFIWLGAFTLLFLLWVRVRVRVSESFHEGALQHLSDKQLRQSDFIEFLTAQSDYKGKTHEQRLKLKINV